MNGWCRKPRPDLKLTARAVDELISVVWPRVWKKRVSKIPRKWIVSISAALASSCCGGVSAEEAGRNGAGGAVRLQAIPSSVIVSFERLQFPGDEPAGVLGSSYVLELAPGWWLGPALYGAASGRRGGLFTWGAEGQRHWRLDGRWRVVTGLYVGGGGGASAPVGGGLMLRPHADLMFDFSGWAAGISASQVSFPSGTIHSAQIGLLVTVHDAFAFTGPGHDGQHVDFSGAGGLGADRLAVATGRYASGSSGGKPLDYVGIRLERKLGPVLYSTFDVAGAVEGGADGYAEAMVGLSAFWPLGTEATRLGAYAAVGLGGGGAVPTGGGPIAKVALSGRLQLSRQVSLEVVAGQARAFGGEFNSQFAQLSVGVKLDDAPRGPGFEATGKTVHDMEWALGTQRYLRAQRKDGSIRGLSTLGLKFRRSLSEHLYLSGQAHSAIAGGAGAYSAGLVGLGTTWSLREGANWSLGAEALVGAAGGGGISSQGGAIVQPMVWLGRDLGRYSRVKVGAGYVKSMRGALSSPVVDLTWAVAFGAP